MRKLTIIMACILLAGFFGYAGYGSGGCVSDEWTWSADNDALMLLNGYAGKNTNSWSMIVKRQKVRRLVSTGNEAFYKYVFSNNGQYLCAYVRSGNDRDYGWITKCKGR